MKQRRKLRVFGHPLHPVVTHFPMALLPVSFLGDLLGVWTDASFWWSFSFYNLALGLVLSLPALITGMIDFLAISKEGNAENVVMHHMTIMIVAIMMFMGSFFIRFGVEVLSGWRLTSTISLSLLGLIFLFIGGWLGGQLVYRYAVGNHPVIDKAKSEKS